MKKKTDFFSDIELLNNCNFFVKKEEKENYKLQILKYQLIVNTKKSKIFYLQFPQVVEFALLHGYQRGRCVLYTLTYIHF